MKVLEYGVPSTEHGFKRESMVVVYSYYRFMDDCKPPQSRGDKAEYLYVLKKLYRKYKQKKWFLLS